jgi:SAM-dependent methyltransferase
LDQVLVTRFVDQLFAALNGSAFAVFVSIGHKTGLIKTMAGLSRSTSAQIAEAAGLQERYVREWLGGMVVSGIVEYSPQDGTYELPREHAVVLTGGAGPNVIAAHTQAIPVLAAVEPQILECFRSGGGPPFSAYRFDTSVPVNDADTDAELLRNRLDIVPPVVQRLKAGIDVADFGCGDGHFVNAMARAFPNSRFTGYDFGQDAVAAGRAEAERWGLTNAEFELEDIAVLEVRDRFDLITAMDAIHDQAKPRAVLSVIFQSLRAGGTYLMGDVRASTNLQDNISHPLGPYTFLWSLTYCMAASLAQGGDGLGAMWGEQKALEYLAEAGFSQVEVRKPEGDVINSYFVCSKSEDPAAR